MAELLKLLEVRRGQERDDDFIECNNMTLINLVLKILGSIHERNLTVIMLIIQVLQNTCSVQIHWNTELLSVSLGADFHVSLSRWWAVQSLLGSVIIWCVSSTTSRQFFRTQERMQMEKIWFYCWNNWQTCGYCITSWLLAVFTLAVFKTIFHFGRTFSHTHINGLGSGHSSSTLNSSTVC